MFAPILGREGVTKGATSSLLFDAQLSPNAAR
jgi:hypothetical protein